MGFVLCHPAAQLLYFAFATGFAAVLNRPGYAAVTAVCAFAYLVRLKGRRGAAAGAVFILLGAVYAALFVSFRHFGATVLRVNFIGNRITLESLLCGAVRALSLIGAVSWLACFFTVFTTDKTVYLIGKVSPRLSLFFSGLFRSVPRISGEGKRIFGARRCVGKGTKDGKAFCRIGSLVSGFSALITRMIDSFAAASDSAKCRGSMLRGRSAYSLYRFDGRDRAIVIFASFLIAATIAAFALGEGRAVYDPEFFALKPTPVSWALFACYAAFCLIPLSLDLYTEWRFKRARNRGCA